MDVAPRHVRALGVAALSGCLAVAASGCTVKRGANADLIAGKQEFIAKCGSCHTLARAGTKGTVGPKLDYAFQAAVEGGLGRTAIRTVVEGQIENPNPQGAMPSGLLQGEAIKDVAAYVAQVAARPGADTGLLTTEAAGEGKPAVEKGGKLEIAADPKGRLSYVTKKATATAGAVTLLMPNTSGISHNIAIEAGAHEASGSGPVLAASKFTTKGSVSVSATLKPGTYTFFCQAPGHRSAGMFGTITVK
jgi:mono/diheme cytochrome c family protein